MSSMEKRKTIGALALGSLLGAAVTFGIVYPVLDASWNEDGAGSGNAVACATAQPQSPKDVSSVSYGTKTAQAKVYNEGIGALKHVNTHYHLGAEHKSITGEYDTAHVTTTTARKLLNAGTVEYGFYCDTTVNALTVSDVAPYAFQHCTNTEVGQTYELHYVYSSGGTGISDGLGGAFALQANPTVIVRAQVYVVTNNDADDVADLMSGWNASKIDTNVGVSAVSDAVTYSGSTTGRSYNNDDACSPYQITWQVDRKCRKVSAKSFDAMCYKMKTDYGMSADTEPHASRDLVIASLSSSYQIALTNVN